MGLWMLEPLVMSLLLTIIVETMFAVMVGVREKKDLLLLGLVNVLTNPVVVFLYYLATYYTGLNAIVVVIVLELSAILVEAYYFKVYGKKFTHPFIFSMSVNLFSFGVGKLINASL